MPMTVVEKIMAAHSRKKLVSAGDILWIDVDVRTARDFGGPNVVKHLKENFQPPYVDDPGRTYFTFDLSTPARTIKYAISQHMLKVFAKETGITVFDVDEGIGTHVLIEKGIVRPGDVAVGTDSHYNILGAIGAFGQGMGDKDIAFAFKTGRIWFEVPPTMKIRVEGKYSWPATARDLTFAVMREVGPSGALGRAIEYSGDAVEGLSLDGRITLASQTTEMGGIIGFIPLSEEVKRFLESRVGSPVKEVLPDRGAEYVEEVIVEVDGLEPMVAAPPNPTNVKPVSELEGMEIDSVFVGSCTEGRYENLLQVARILKGKKVKKGVTFRITPATKEVWAMAIKDGLVDIFLQAGAVVFSNPGCGGCAEGMAGLVGEGEVELSTTNRNFPGKQGPGKVYLVSAATAAASAVKGYLTGAW